MKRWARLVVVTLSVAGATLGAECGGTLVGEVETLGAEFVTPLSGFPGTVADLARPELRPTSAHGLLTGLVYGEESDRPCRILVYFHDAPHDAFVGGTWNQCGPSNTNQDFSTQTLRFEEPDVYVRGIRVCANTGNHRIKGIEIWGTRLSVDGVDAPASSDPSVIHSRLNCDNQGNDQEWRQRRDCPGGMVARGLVVGVEASEPDDIGEWGEITGIATGLGLVCTPARLVLAIEPDSDG